MPALGRLTINEAQGVNQQWVVWGCETNDAYDITAATASLFYEAESRALLNGTVQATLNGASGAVSNNAALTIALPSTPIPVWSTRTVAGVHLTHVGTFRVFARVTTSLPVVGNISLRMDWGVGDLGRYTSNDTTTLEPDQSGPFRIVDLGLVTVPPPVTGAQRWEGRIVANSTASDRLYIDHMWLVPTVVSGEASASAQSPALTTLSVFDSFDQAAGVLTGKVSPIGAQTWTFLSGDPDDWTVTTGVASRATTSDVGQQAANNGRYLSAGTTSYTTVTASVDINWSVLPPQQSLGLTTTGIALRMIDANNVVRVGVSNPTTNSTQPAIQNFYVQGGVLRSFFSFTNVSFSANTWWTLTVSCDSGGRLRVWWNPRGQPLGSPVRDITHSLLATGGALAAGRVGIYDANESVTNVTRLMDSFSVFTAAGTTADAALFASRSLEIRHDAVVRLDATGTVAQPVFYEGDHLQVPPTGREKRLVRFIVKASRSAPGQGADAGIDDINATLAVTPRYLSVPSP